MRQRAGREESHDGRIMELRQSKDYHGGQDWFSASATKLFMKVISLVSWPTGHSVDTPKQNKQIVEI